MLMGLLITGHAWGGDLRGCPLAANGGEGECAVRGGIWPGGGGCLTGSAGVSGQNSALHGGTEGGGRQHLMRRMQGMVDVSSLLDGE
jgi:hypothetical protein